MDFITSPRTSYKSLEDISRFNMIWGSNLLLLPIFLLLMFIHILLGDQGWITSLIATAIVATNLVILKATRKYRIVALYSIAVSVVLFQLLIFYIKDSTVLADVMWGILVSFFTFFMIGSLAGTIVMLLNLTGILIFFNQATPEQLSLKQFHFESGGISKIINTYYVGIALSLLFARIMSNRKKLNQQYENELARSETLLKEIHHRVKNNLQIISSLLKLQAAEIEHEELQEHFDEAIGRIRSMALIHEKMYGNNDSGQVDIKSYLYSLSSEIVESLHMEENVKFEVESQISLMDLKSLVPISLIFNELITNSLKHAFSGQEEGRISTNIEMNKNQVSIKYADNGTWKTPNNESSFGLELIKTLTSQLDGKCERKIENGTHFTFVFDRSQLFFTEND